MGSQSFNPNQNIRRDMPLYLKSLPSLLRPNMPHYVVIAAFILFSFLFPSKGKAQLAIGEINGSFPSGNGTNTFHGYVVFLETSGRQYVPLVAAPPTGSCSQAYYAPLLPTYQWAQQADAFLALNGSFIDPEGEYKPGDCRLVFGPVKSNGVTVAPITTRPDGKGNPALLFAKDGAPSIKMATKTAVDPAYNVVSGQWEAGPQLGSNGSLLIENGVIGSDPLPVPEEAAPRTAVGLTQNGILILVVIEGGPSGSNGTTLPYLAQLLKVCGAYNAINLDGGGSSTMTYLPDPRVPVQESLALYNAMKLSQSQDTPVFQVTQRDPRIPFASCASNLLPPSDSNAANLLYRPVAIHFGFALRQAARR
jgi:Phosphodiester glycosidase